MPNVYFRNVLLQTHRGTGNFLPGGGGGKLFAQKILASYPNFYETVTKAVLAYEGGSFSGSIPPNFEHNYLAIDKHLEKLLP